MTRELLGGKALVSQVASPCHLYEDAHGGHPLHDPLHHRPLVYLENLTGRFDVAFYHRSLQRMRERKGGEEREREGKGGEERGREGKSETGGGREGKRGEERM